MTSYDIIHPICTHQNFCADNSLKSMPLRQHKYEPPSMPASLTDLPNEVIFQILLRVPASSAPALQRISRRFNDLTQSLLWKHHCRTQFRYWSEGEEIQKKLLSNEASTDWKRVFKRRHMVEKTASHELDSILGSQRGRIRSSEIIARMGYDAKDMLLRNLSVGEDTKDVLARRYMWRVLGHKIDR